MQQAALDLFRDCAREIWPIMDASGADAKAIDKFDYWLKRLRRLYARNEGKFTADETALIFLNFQDPAVIADPNLFVKYRLRALNVLREMLRVKAYLPEIVQGQKSTALDLSAGGCGNFIVTRYYGSVTISAEYYDALDTYAPIHRALAIKPIPFDGTKIPYEFDSSGYDYVVCNQALNFYSEPEEWHHAVGEMVRIARKRVVIVQNDAKSADRDRPNPEEDMRRRSATIDQINEIFDALPEPPVDADANLEVSVINLD